MKEEYHVGMEGRKVYVDPNLPPTKESMLLERNNRWYYARQNINGICTDCKFPVLDSRKDMTGQLKCKSHFI